MKVFPAPPTPLGLEARQRNRGVQIHTSPTQSEDLSWLGALHRASGQL